MQRASLTEDKKNKEASAEAAKNNRPRKETNRISKDKEVVRFKNIRKGVVMNMTVLSNWNTEDANSSYGIPFSYVYVGKNE